MIDDLNKLNQVDFIEELGWIFEHSPWVAERAWSSRPFRSLAHLQKSMEDVVEQASGEEKLALLRKHPDLAARVQMADASVKEQAGAGLDALTEEEYKEFLELNDLYKEKFAFPFILAVKGHTKESIRNAMQTRLKLSERNELEEALNQIYRIAQFRLETVIKN
ncbi:2-oxo-4-hydroxy-4-carboxy-5-ureidoimidazoline decarboxylase [Bacillaceae bacterium C204]|uniref:2-oxo-4-hydroxy-4-carboxy-5-ureidoimidazoline decarboxylase n=1 Tax=Neobacillus sp. 204 TaxID=3383351 RepID=UPI00397864AE